MKCPICKQADINEDTTTCPDCNSDLEGLSHIKKIGEVLNNQKKYLIGVGSVALVAVIFLSFTLIKDNEVTPPPISKEEVNKLTAENSELSGKLKDLKGEFSTLKTELEELKKKEAEEMSEGEQTIVENTSDAEDIPISKSEETIHTVSDGETLYLIAKKYYGNGYQYKKLASENGISDPNIIAIGQTLKINAN
ncbi:MAG: LysM peptidoglycan-binding domain-containing protein [Bacteroidia bacterium]|nr:LysM peptidoglycan-binding domain-containing protein [Bacteroidia bacterium]